MGKNSVLQKSQYLGIWISTANHRLSRKIMFFLLQKYGEDNCFKCRQKIQNIEELTIDHIKPWLNIDPSLFWDLENIAFSHRKCNKVHKTNRKCQIGLFWCQHCRRCLPPENFGSPKDRAGHYKRSYCNPCRYVRKKLGLSY